MDTFAIPGIGFGLGGMREKEKQHERWMKSQVLSESWLHVKQWRQSDYFKAKKGGNDRLKDGTQMLCSSPV